MTDITGVNVGLGVRITGINSSTGLPDNYLDIDSIGRLTIKLNDGAGTSVTLGQKVMALSLPVTIASDQSAIATLNPTDTLFATQNITILDTGTATTTVSNGQVLIIGTPTAGSAATFTVNSVETGQLQISGTFTGTVQVETSFDGLTYVAHSLHQLSSAIFTATFTQPVLGSLNLGGKSFVRVRSITSFSGTATIRLMVSVNATSVYIANSLKLVDTSNLSSPITMNIAAASTATIATQSSIVMALSPNSPLPTGSNTIGSLNNISGTISLPTGAATASNQSIEITALGTLNTSVQNTQGTVIPGTVATKSDLIGGQFNTVLPTLTNTQQSAVQLDSSGRILISPFSNSSIIKAQLQDNAGNGINSDNSKLLVQDAINGTGQNRAQSVTTSAAEALGAGTILTNRILLTITPTNGVIYWGYSSGVTITNGSPIFPNNTLFLSITDNVHVYIIAATTVDARISEAS